MRVGSLNKRIDIQAPTKVSDGMGSYTQTYTTVMSSIAAAIWTVSGKETVQNMQNVGTITHKIRIQYRSVLRPTWRVKFGNRYFAIVSPPIDPDMKHRWLDLMCKEASI
jgi:SPP1 family predicted phage head-tail adaptor